MNMPWRKPPPTPDKKDKEIRKAAILDGLGAPVGHCGKNRTWTKRTAAGEPECDCPWPHVIDTLLDRIIELEDSKS